MIYLYDGTFQGFLTCVYEHYYGEKAQGIYKASSYQISLMEDHKNIKTNDKKADKVMKALQEKLSWESLHNINYAFLSNDEKKDTYLLSYIVYGFKVGGQLDLQHTHEAVYEVHRLSHSVGFERHRFLGLLRFQEVGGVLYANFSPDHDIVSLLAPHFSDRLKMERFIIHDVKRSQAIIYDGNSWWLTDFTLNKELDIGEDEKFYAALWKGYFDQVAIKERKNLRLQQQFVPKKYRNHLTEFKQKEMPTYDIMKNNGPALSLHGEYVIKDDEGWRKS